MSANGAPGPSRYLRIEQHGSVATDTKVIFVDGDTETDISSRVFGVELDMQVGAAVTATIRAYVGTAVIHNVDAERVLVELERIQRSRWPWFRRLRDVSSFGSRFRKVVRA